MKYKTERITVKIYKKTKKYPYRARKIHFDMIANGNQVQAVESLIANMGYGCEDYCFVRTAIIDDNGKELEVTFPKQEVDEDRNIFG